MAIVTFELGIKMATALARSRYTVVAARTRTGDHIVMIEIRRNPSLSGVAEIALRSGLKMILILADRNVAVMAATAATQYL